MPNTPFTSVTPRLGRSVSLDQAAQLLRVSRRTVYNRIREGRLMTIRTIGGSQRVLLDSLDLRAGLAAAPSNSLAAGEADALASQLKVTSW